MVTAAAADPRSAAAARRSAQEAVDVVGAQADLLVVLLADVDVVVDVEVVHGVALLVEPDQRALDLEVHLHRLAGPGGAPRVRPPPGPGADGAGRRDPPG